MSGRVAASSGAVGVTNMKTVEPEKVVSHRNFVSIYS